MNLELFNNLMHNARENDFIQSFRKELSNYLNKKNNMPYSQKDDIKADNLKKEGCLYQVVEMGLDSVYLQNINNNRICEEKDISSVLLDKIGNDSVLRYKGGEYIFEEELTQKFFDNLVDAKEYKKIQEDFIKESNMSEIDVNTLYRIEIKNKEYSILSYGDNENNTIKVPNELIPFWANGEDFLYYENGKFNRDLKD